MNAKNIPYWITTILVAFPIGSGGVAQLAHLPATVDGFVHILHYPPYFVTILGFWKDVSYTHLDVYKRQLHIRYLQVRTRQCIGRPATPQADSGYDHSSPLSACFAS